MAAVSKAVTATSAAAGGAGADTKPPLFPFVFVGCWNQPGVTCREEGLARDAVAHAISSMEDIKYIILGGDNVYPRPLRSGEKNKVHDPTVFDEGIQLFEASGKPIIGSFGNHNVDTIKHQMKTFGLSKTYYQREFSDGVHVLVLDTNIVLSGSSDPEYEIMCVWFNTTVAELDRKRQQYFVVQHEPYFTARSKGFGELRNSGPLLATMDIYPPIAVLCADTHHYQYATIQNTTNSKAPEIHQFIVGTGGAKHDPHMDDFSETELMGGSYKFTQKHAETGFGFLRVSDSDHSRFEFIKVREWPAESKGGYRRTPKRRKAGRKSRKQKLRNKRR